mmetsp:Transcript_21750/g.44023  ORF Transcript_21750/g.44023 Transcript_21750/m.44023 type:complete len:221 (-) Transcript_21750:539-1201(-)
MYHFGRPFSAVSTIDSHIFPGIGRVPASLLSSAVLADLSPGIRTSAPDDLTASRIDSALSGKLSTSPSGRTATKVCPHDLASLLLPHIPRTADPLSAPARISTQSERPAPLCPPKVAIAPPSSASEASVVHAPSLPYATFAGSGSPLALALRTPNRATADVAMSKVKGWEGVPSGPSGSGTPTARGLVPKTGRPPGAAATNSGELASATPTAPLRAILST